MSIRPDMCLALPSLITTIALLFLRSMFYVLSIQRSIATAARNSPGGLVIAQVKRIAANGSIPARQVAVPGPLVDCVVVVDEEDHDKLHPMSYLERHNSAFTGEIRTPQQSIKALPMSLRKIIARRAFLQLRVSSRRLYCIPMKNQDSPIVLYSCEEPRCWMYSHNYFLATSPLGTDTAK